MDKPEFVEDTGRTDDHYFEGVLYDNSKCIYCQEVIYETADFEWVDGMLHSAECPESPGTSEHVARLIDIHPDRRKYYASHWLQGKMK
jgi:hypothetical protein